MYQFVESKDLSKNYLEISVWSFNVYELHTFLGQISIYLNENLIYEDEEYWFKLGDQSN